MSFLLLFFRCIAFVIQKVLPLEHGDAEMLLDPFPAEMSVGPAVGRGYQLILLEGALSSTLSVPRGSQQCFLHPSVIMVAFP